MITLLSRLWCFAFLLAALPLAAEESSNAPIPPHTIPEGTTFLMRLEDRLDTNRLRSEEHTSELQSHSDLVCRLLLEKKKYMTIYSSLRYSSNDPPSTDLSH